MQNESKTALVDVVASMIGGDIDKARSEVENLVLAHPGGIERFGLLFDPSSPGPARQQVHRQFGSQGDAVLRRFLLEHDDPCIQGDLAAFCIGRGPHNASFETGSAILMHQYAVEFIAASDFPGLVLTPVELRLIFLLLVGLDLREIARIDNVSYETRRSQFKTLASKLGLSRQSELTRMFLGRLLVMLGRAETRAQDDRHRIFFDTMRHPELAQVRPFLLTGPEGRTVRVVEMGPKTGRPVIVLHSMAFPVTSAAEVRAFDDHDIRALWPIRQGALSPRDVQIDPDAQRAACLADIALVHDLFCDGPAMLVGLLSGAPYAIDAARAMPDRIAALTLVGACYKPTTEGMAGGALRRGLFSLARDNPAIMMMALRLVTSRIARPGSYSRILQDHYRASPGDLDIISRGLKDRSIDRIIQSLTTSLVSIRNDFFLQSEFDWSVLRDLMQPVHFIHGAEDPLHSVETIEALARTLPRAEVEVMPGAGQLLLQHHFSAAVGLLAEIVAGMDPVSGVRQPSRPARDAPVGRA